MTKLMKARRFMKETGSDKKTAMEYLRRSNYDYQQAITLYNFCNFDMEKFADACKKATDVVVDAMNRLMEILPDILDELGKNIGSIMERIQAEIDAEGVDEE